MVVETQFRKQVKNKPVTLANVYAYINISGSLWAMRGCYDAKFQGRTLVDERGCRLREGGWCIKVNSDP